MANFYDSNYCKNRLICKACRSPNHQMLREQLAKAYDDLEDSNFECPHGYTYENVPPQQHGKAESERAASQEKPKMPSVVQQAINLGKSVANAAKAYAQGGRALEPEELQQERIKICESCEFFNTEQTRCFKCGCNLPVKIAVVGQRCPIGKW